MTKQITLEEALELVSFEQDKQGYWRVFAVNLNGYVYGNLRSGVGGKLNGDNVFPDGRQLMTKHPLTDEICDQIHGGELGDGYPYDEDDMRAAADWQLAQVVEWMKDHNTEYIREDSMGIYFDEDKCIDDFKKAMRPPEISEKVQRWIEGASEEELLKLSNQLENN